MGLVMDWRGVYKGPCVKGDQMSLKCLSDMQMKVFTLLGYDILTRKKWSADRKVTLRVTCAVGEEKTVRTGESSRRLCRDINWKMPIWKINFYWRF